MLQESKAFSSFSVKDIDQAKDFYELLGLKVNKKEMGILELNLGDSGNIMVYPKENHLPATFKVLNFLVLNIDEAVNQLTAEGIVFEQYNTGYIKTDEKGISRGEQGPKIAWFKDSSGNIISVLEE